MLFVPDPLNFGNKKIVHVVTNCWYYDTLGRKSKTTGEKYGKY